MASILSDGDSMLLDGFQVESDSWGRTLTVQSDATAGNVSQSFPAVLSPAQSVDPALDLGADIREVTIAEVRQDIDIGLEWGAIVTDANGATWKVIRRENNASDINVKYYLVAVIAGKDS